MVLKSNVFVLSKDLSLEQAVQKAYNERQVWEPLGKKLEIAYVQVSPENTMLTKRSGVFIVKKVLGIPKPRRIEVVVEERPRLDELSKNEIRVVWDTSPFE